MSDALDKFGMVVVENFFDRSVDNYLLLRDGRLKAKSELHLQNEFSKLSAETISLVDVVVLRLLTGAVHDILFAVQDAHDRGLGLELRVDGVDVAKESGMLHGECVGETGWIARFSRHPLFGKLDADAVTK
jgi:hypothetical protein